MPVLTNSTRELLKATYTPIEHAQAQRKGGRALEKASFVHGLKLQQGDVERVRRVVESGSSREQAPWDALQQFEPASHANPAQLAASLPDAYC